MPRVKSPGSSIELRRLGFALRGLPYSPRVADAVDTGAITLRGARLILLHRVVGVRTADIARAEGRRPCTVRKHRQQAEVALAGTEVA